LLFSFGVTINIKAGRKKVGACVLLKYNKFMNKLNVFDWVALVLVLVGGLNWGLVGIFKFDLVGAIFGDMSGLSRIVYSLVGLSAVYLIFVCSKFCKK